MTYRGFSISGYSNFERMRVLQLTRQSTLVLRHVLPFLIDCLHPSLQASDPGNGIRHPGTLSLYHLLSHQQGGLTALFLISHFPTHPTSTFPGPLETWWGRGLSLSLLSSPLLSVLSASAYCGSRALLWLTPTAGFLYSSTGI